MKKKLLMCFTIAMTMSLTSCDAFFNMFLNNGSNPYSYRSVDESYKPAAATSLPPNSITPLKASSNYMDFVKNNVYAISSTPCVGETNILVIPIWFKDSASFISSTRKESVRKEIEAVYFGTNAETGWRSVKSFYEEESHGALTMSGTVSSWYEVDRSYQYYQVDDAASKTSALVKQATDWYFSKYPSDSRTNYDKDKDGYLDGVMCIYAAPDQLAYGRDDYTNLWAYCFWIQDTDVKNVNKPGANAFFWASYDFMYSKTKAYSHTLASNYGSGDNSNCKLDAHTYIHEMGHMFGLDDYYDYSDHSYDPAGAFSMQDRNVGGHDPFSCYALGWAQAYMPTASITINLKPFTESGEVILLSPNNSNSAKSPFDEYILLEYYTPTGLNEFDVEHMYRGSVGPAGAKQGGIRLWHVDARLLYYSYSNPSVYSITNNPKKAGGAVTLAMSNTYADGKEETEGYLSPLGNDYYNYNILQMIRNDTSATYKPNSGNGLMNKNLFRQGDSFTMSQFAKQFVNSGKLNDKSALGFKFEVNAIYENFAEIAITKI